MANLTVSFQLTYPHFYSKKMALFSQKKTTEKTLKKTFQKNNKNNKKTVKKTVC